LGIFLAWSVFAQVMDSIVALNGAAPGGDSVERSQERRFHNLVAANS